MADVYEIENCECLKDTGKAILCEAEEIGEPFWVPQSQVHADSEVYGEGDVGTLIVTAWWAEKKGWL